MINIHAIFNQSIYPLCKSSNLYLIKQKKQKMRKVSNLQKSQHVMQGTHAIRQLHQHGCAWAFWMKRSGIDVIARRVVSLEINIQAVIVGQEDTAACGILVIVSMPCFIIGVIGTGGEVCSEIMGNSGGSCQE
mmetsp:Transcript_39747/g.72737  ORF Transcript_39747/g.72737 Transcript_39747/m.72737 type:complete len:133 (+) Transcript_39747:206-604(+)